MDSYVYVTWCHLVYVNNNNLVEQNHHLNVPVAIVMVKHIQTSISRKKAC